MLWPMWMGVLTLMITVIGVVGIWMIVATMRARKKAKNGHGT